MDARAIIAEAQRLQGELDLPPGGGSDHPTGVEAEYDRLAHVVELAEAGYVSEAIARLGDVA